MQSDLKKLSIAMLAVAMLTFLSTFLITLDLYNWALISSAIILVMSVIFFISPIRSKPQDKKDSDFMFEITNILFDLLFITSIIYSLFSVISNSFLLLGISSIDSFKKLIRPFNSYLQYLIFVFALIAIFFGVVPAVMFENTAPLPKSKKDEGNSVNKRQSPPPSGQPKEKVGLNR